MAKREKKYLLPLILLTIIFWSGLVATTIFIDPLILRDFPFSNSYLAFFLIFFFAWFFLLTLILNHTRRGLIYAVALTIFMILRLMRLGNIINTAFLIGIAAVIDFYLTNR